MAGEARVIDLGVRRDDKGGLSFPELSRSQQKMLLGPEIGTEFDIYTRMFATFSGGDVFEVGEWAARDMDTMLRRDGDARMVEQALTLPIRQANYHFEPQKGDTGELELIQSHFNEPFESGGVRESWHQIIGQMAGARIYRKTFFEKKYGIVGDQVRLLNLAWRPPSTCAVRRDEHTAAFDGFRQRAWWFFSDPSKTSKSQRNPYGKDFTGYLDIPKQRSYVYIHGTELQPLTGMSDMDVCYWCYKQKQKMLFLWFQFLENQSLPKIAAYGSDPTQADTNAEALAAMKSSGVAGFQRPPQGAKLFDIIESSGKGAEQFTAALTFLSMYQAKSIMGGFLDLGSAASLGRGSYALSESQTQFFLQMNQAVVNELQDSFTTDVLAPICVLNKGANAKTPRLRSEPLAAAMNTQILTALMGMVTAPALRVPDEFVDMLIERASSLLDLPPQRVADVIAKAAKWRAKQVKDQGADNTTQGAFKIAGAVGATFTLLPGGPPQDQQPGEDATGGMRQGGNAVL